MLEGAEEVVDQEEDLQEDLEEELEALLQEVLGAGALWVARVQSQYILRTSNYQEL